MKAVCCAAGTSRRKRKKQEERCNTKPAHAAGITQPAIHPARVSLSGSSTRIWAFLPAGGAVQVASTLSRARAGIQMCSQGTDCY